MSLGMTENDVVVSRSNVKVTWTKVIGMSPARDTSEDYRVDHCLYMTLQMVPSFLSDTPPLEIAEAVYSDRGVKPSVTEISDRTFFSILSNSRRMTLYAEAGPKIIL